MIYRPNITLPIALLAAQLFVAPAPAQKHGMAVARAPHPRAVIGLNGRTRFHRSVRSSSAGYAYYPYYDYDGEPYDSGYQSVPPEMPPNEVVSAPPSEQPAPVASPAESLVLENHDGQWVRIPASPQYLQPQSNSASEISRKEAYRPPAKLPPTVLVFRDGHQEEVARYVVQGNVLFASADYWSTGSWTKRIPIVELDVPASVKLNAARGGTFSLPTRPHEVVVRF